MTAKKPMTNNTKDGRWTKGRQQLKNQLAHKFIKAMLPECNEMGLSRNVLAEESMKAVNDVEKQAGSSDKKLKLAFAQRMKAEKQNVQAAKAAVKIAVTTVGATIFALDRHGLLR